MKIAIVGTGYVGLVTGTCFADTGIEVTCVDIDCEKIERLKRGEIPIYEPGLEELVTKNMKSGRLRFTTSLTDTIDDVEVIFAAVGTPPNDDGSADLRAVEQVAREVGRTMNGYKLLVVKSTVPVGTVYRVKEIIAEELERRGLDVEFDVASNPEFLKEGDAINDFSRPDRIVIGVESERAKGLMERLYEPFVSNGYPAIYMDICSAEMTKYAANAMLATRISFMNDIANLCDILGADVNMVRHGISLDERIGSKFLNSGCGYGGSCFPKDLKALINTARASGYALQVLEAAERVNEHQKKVVFEKLNDYFDGQLDGLTVAVWGLSFKPETNDIREAPARVLIGQLLDAGCRVKAYDPVATQEMKKVFGERIEYSRDMYDAACDSDAVVLVTEWKEFRMPSWNTLGKVMKRRLIVDGRNIYSRKIVESEGFAYIGIGIR